MPLARRNLAAATITLGVLGAASCRARDPRPTASRQGSIAKDAGQSVKPPGQPAVATGAEESMATPEAPTRAAIDLSREQSLIEEARAALKASDLATARAKAAEAVIVLLARTESEREGAWLRLIDSAGLAAWDAQDARTARLAWEQVLEVQSRTLPPDHLDLQRARLTLASALCFQGYLPAGRVLQEQVLEVYSRTLPPDHLDLQSARLNLANTLRAQGDLPAARVLVEQVLEVYTKTLPPDHPSLQWARMTLANTLYSQGDLPAARAIHEQVLADLSRTLPPEHPDLQAARMNLANTLCAQGDLPAARALYEQVSEVGSRTLPPDNLELQAAHLNLANTLFAQGDLPGARALYEQVLEVYSKTLPPESPELQAARGNLANVLYLQGDLSGACNLYQDVLEVSSETLPPDHPDLQRARLNLGNTLYALGDLPAARVLLEQGLEVYSRTLPPEHHDLQLARGYLANTLAGIGALHRGGEGANTEEWERGRERCAELVSSLALAASRIARSVTLSSSREAEERCASLHEMLSNSLSYAMGYGVFDPDPAIARAAFILSETTRASGLASARIAHLARSVEQCAELREEIQSAGKELARLVQAGGTRDAYDAVIERRDRAQRELVQIASGSPQAIALLEEPDPAVLSGGLSPGEAVVAYRRYKRWGIPIGEFYPRSVESLCAFVIRKGEALQCVELGPIGPIEAAVKDLRGALGVAEGRGIGVDTRTSNPPAASQHARRIVTLVLDPLISSLQGVRRLVLVLDDVLQAVPIDALPARDTQSSGSPPTPASPGGPLLGDLYEIELRGTVQEILSSAAPASDAGLAVVLGGADYFAEPGGDTAKLLRTIGTASGVEAASPSTATVPGMLRGGAWGEGFAPLPATLEEARGVAELFERAFGASRRDSARPVVLEKRKASRAAVTELAPKARFLHLATHGWFAPESVRSWSDPDPLDSQGGVIARTGAEERVKGSSPMLLCGLALAGANLPPDAVGRFPGLVTAEEISGWDLSNCELAVLSACDTNVGERRAGQGVASLQKALHMAGARTVITSLWKVPDEATKELMLVFYRRIWIEKKPKAQALWEAKKRLRDAKDETGQARYTTRDWAAWVLTGDPR